jgi:Outer membrane protein beta-barrel domain
MNKWWTVGVLAGLAVCATTQRAEADGFELGARTGYGIPLGKIDGDSDMSDGIKGMIPLQLDVGYRLNRAFSLGGYVMYGVGFVGDQTSQACERARAVPGVSASCSARDLRLGLQVQYHFLPGKDLDPWLGAGFGYEWLTFAFDISGGGQQQDVSSTGKGFEFINLQGGLDFKVAPGLALGPYLSLSVAQYGSASSSCSGNACSSAQETLDIPNKAAHQWLLLGVRGTFVFGDDSSVEE